MTARAGDLIVVESERVAQAARKGTREQQLHELGDVVKAARSDGPPLIARSTARLAASTGSSEGAAAAPVACWAEAEVVDIKKTAQASAIILRNCGVLREIFCNNVVNS